MNEFTLFHWNWVFFQVCATTKRDKDRTSGLLAVCLTHWAIAVDQSGVTSFFWIDKYLLQCAHHMRNMSFWQLSPPLTSIIFTGSTGKPCDGAFKLLVVVMEMKMMAEDVDETGSR